LSKDYFNRRPLHIAALEGKVEVLEKLWEWGKELQLKPEDISNVVLLSKKIFN
jgi:hypothetical protein